MAEANPHRYRLIKNGCWFKGNSILLPQADPRKVIKGFQDSRHLGRDALAALVTCVSGRKGLRLIISEVVRACLFVSVVTQEVGPAITLSTQHKEANIPRRLAIRFYHSHAVGRIIPSGTSAPG